MANYFALNLDTRTIVSEHGDTFTVDQFKKILSRAAAPMDMTLMLQRLVRYDFDFDRLENYYELTA